MFKKVIICLLILMMSLSLAACGKTTEPKAEGTGYILTSYKALPDSITNVSRCFLDGDRLFLCCREEGDREHPATYAAAIELDGSNFQKLPLDLAGTEILLDIAPDGQGGLWGLRMAPNGDESPDYALCRFDPDGGRAAEIPLNSLMEEADALRWMGKDLFLNADRDGKLCVVARDGKTACFLFDRGGNYLFTLKDSGDPRSVIAMAAGPLAVCSTKDGGGTYSLLPIDMEKQAWGEPIEIGTAANVFGGFGPTACYLFDSSDFYGCGLDAGERYKLFNWSNLGLASGDTHVCPLADGRFAVVAGAYSQTQLLSYEFCIVEPGNDTRTVLTMLSLQPEDSLLEAVALFNKSSDEYRVELTSVFSQNESVSSDEWNSAVTRLNTALIAGEVPDLLDLHSLPADAYSRRGLLEDLYPYLQNDPEIHRSDYYENVFAALSIDGKLPYVTSSVRIFTMLADPGAAGAARGWTMEEFAAMKNSGTLKMEFLPPTLLLKTILGADNCFVDWKRGDCSFDSEKFARLLELCLNQATADLEWTDEDGLFAGQANCIYTPLDSVLAVAYYNAQLGGNANPIGMPNLSGEVMHILEPANKIGFSTDCEHKDGAWAFVRSFLEPRLQESGWYFPYRKSSFEKICSAAVKGHTIWLGGMYDRQVGEEDIALARELLETANYCANRDRDLVDVVVQISGSYFAGGGDAQETASEIQNRAKLYVGEHAG